MKLSFKKHRSKDNLALLYARGKRKYGNTEEKLSISKIVLINSVERR